MPHGIESPKTGLAIPIKEATPRGGAAASFRRGLLHEVEHDAEPGDAVDKLAAQVR
jgi:hypothetical protein